MLDFRLFKPPYPCSSSLWVKDRKVRGLVLRGYTYLLASLSSISHYLDQYAPNKDTDRRVRSTLCRLILSQKSPERGNVVYLQVGIALLAFPFPL